MRMEQQILYTSQQGSVWLSIEELTLRFYDLRSEKVLVGFLQSELWPHVSEELPSFFLRNRKLSHQELLVQNPPLLWAQIMSVSL